MGNWKRRPRIKYFNESDQRPQLRFQRPPPHSSVSGEDNVPSWEKRFCYLVGSVPWWKVVHSGGLICCHPIVMNWNDSAVEETFHNAKQRFWAQINKLSCDISLPDPNMYIDDVYWNSYIDPEVILDLDREYIDTCIEDKCANFDNSVAVQDSSLHDKNQCNPWESSNVQSDMHLMDNGWGWKPRNAWAEYSRNLDNDDNPWEHGCTETYGDVKKNPWRDFGDKRWTSILGDSHNINQLRNWGDIESSWKNNCLDVGSVKDKGWTDSRDRSWGWNHLEKNTNELKPQVRSFHEDNGASLDRGWGHGGDNSWVNRKQENYNKGSKDVELKGGSGGWGSRNRGCGKREGSHQYIPRSKSSRYQGNFPQ